MARQKKNAPKDSFSETILDSLGEPILAVDDNETILAFNKKAEKLFGYPRRELLGAPLDVLIPPESGEKHKRHFRSFIDARPSNKRLTVHGRQKDGKLIPLELSLSKTRFKGRPIAIAVGTKSSENRFFEDSLKNLQRFIEQASVAILKTDLKGNIIYVNPQWERLTGYTFKEALGRNPSILKSGKHSARFFKTLWDTLVAGKVWKGVFINRKKDGTLFSEVAELFPIKDHGSPVQYASVSRDITSLPPEELVQASEQGRAELAARMMEDSLRVCPPVAERHMDATAQVYGIQPLKTAHPKRFKELVAQYGAILDQAMQEKIFSGNSKAANLLYELSQELGTLMAGSRDATDIHSESLALKLSKMSGKQKNYYIEESRWVWLKLMGLLVTYYRNRHTLPSQKK